MTDFEREQVAIAQEVKGVFANAFPYWDARHVDDIVSAVMDGAGIIGPALRRWDTLRECAEAQIADIVSG